MKRYLSFLGTYLIVQPVFFLGIAVSMNKKLKDEVSNIPAVVEYKNNQILITKSNSKKNKDIIEKLGNSELHDLENQLARLEDEPKLINGGASTTQLGQKMKKLSKTVLFTG